MGEGRLSIGRSAGSFHHWLSPLLWQHLVFWADWFCIVLLFSVKMVCQILNFIVLESIYIIDAYQLNYFAKPYVWLFCFIVNTSSLLLWRMMLGTLSGILSLNLQVMCNLIGTATWPASWLLLLGASDLLLFHVCIVMGILVLSVPPTHPSHTHSVPCTHANTFQGQDLHYVLNVGFSCFKPRIS